MNQQIKAGDKVYYPARSKTVYTVKQRDDGSLYVEHETEKRIHHDIYDGGASAVNPDMVGFVHATPRNHKLLCELYGIQYQRPPLTPKKIIKKLLKNQKYVLCCVSDYDPAPDITANIVLIKAVINGLNMYIDVDGEYWEYATPFDPTTGKTIIDLVDGVAVLEGGDE